MRPTNPAVLDVRSREQARFAEAAANAALRLARAELNRAIADKELANTDLTRIQTLRQKGTVSQVEMDRAVHEARATQSAFDTAEAAIEIRQAEPENARAQLIGFEDQQTLGTMGARIGQTHELPIRAQITRTVPSLA